MLAIATQMGNVNEAITAQARMAAGASEKPSGTAPKLRIADAYATQAVHLGNSPVCSVAYPAAAEKSASKMQPIEPYRTSPKALITLGFALPPTVSRAWPPSSEAATRVIPAKVTAAAKASAPTHSYAGRACLTRWRKPVAKI